MADLEESPGHRLADAPRLESWKEIAAYLNRHVTTVRRWEKQEGLPVHRHLHDKLGSVYAFRAEVDEWWRGRRASLETSEGEAGGSLNQSPIADLAGVEGGNGAGAPVLAFVECETIAEQTALGPAPARGGVGLATLAEAQRPDAPDAPWSGIKRWAAALIMLMLGAAAGVVVMTSRWVAPVARGPVARFVLPIERGLVEPGELELSPNGAYLAYTSVRSGVHTLYLRELANPEATALATFEGANHPFFSPDSQWLGFFADGQMKKVSVHGGAPVKLADAPHNRRATWDSRASIVFAPSGRAGLFQVSANGGSATSLTTPVADRLETSHAEPHWLPRSEAVVFVGRGETGTETGRDPILSISGGFSRVSW